MTGPGFSVSNEETNGCQATTDDPCQRTGTCSIQGADWFQTVTVDRGDIFDTQGWPGLCDMVHVALVQGDCEPPGAQTQVTAHLSATSFAEIPEIVGPLACAGEALTPAGAVPNGASVPGTPLSVRRATPDALVLSWEASCSPTDPDYAIYEGTLGDFASHEPFVCSTSGTTEFSLGAPGGSTYYLVVPVTTNSEGSHGRSSSGAERAPGPATCFPRSIGACP